MMNNNTINSLKEFLSSLPRPHRLGIAALSGILLLLLVLQDNARNEDGSFDLSQASLVASAEAATSPKTTMAPIATKQYLARNAENHEPNIFVSAPQQKLAYQKIQASPTPLSDQGVAGKESAPQEKKTQIKGISTAPLTTTPISATPKAPDPVVPATPVDTHQYKTVEIKSGDTLAAAFKKAGIGHKQMYNLLNGHKKAKALAKIHPGNKLTFKSDAAGQLVELQHIETPLKKHIFTRTEKGYKHNRIERSPEVKLVHTHGTINLSLYGAAKKAKLEDRLIMELAKIFGWDIDFALDIRKGDQIKVVYEELYLDGEKLGNGNIVAAEFINQGEAFRAVRYTHTDGQTHYYTPDGKSMRKAFLRAPVDFRRISDNFNPRRLHPVTKTVKPHRGIDYAAKTGTPVWSSGDGKVIRAGYSKYNGNYVVIQHGGNIQTKYLHLHKRKVKTGQRVKQKQIIGTVGSTGLSTGPHLHYEFLLNGVHRNPRTIVQKLPKAQAIAKNEKTRFLQQTKQQVALLDQKPGSQVAKKKSASITPDTVAL